jgi:hypothetical protein
MEGVFGKWARGRRTGENFMGGLGTEEDKNDGFGYQNAETMARRLLFFPVTEHAQPWLTFFQLGFIGWLSWAVREVSLSLSLLHFDPTTSAYLLRSLHSAIFHHRPQWTDTPTEGKAFPITILDFNRFTNPPIPSSPTFARLSSPSYEQSDDTIRYRTLLRPEDPTSQDDLTTTEFINPPKPSLSSPSASAPDSSSTSRVVMRQGPRLSVIEKSNIFLDDIQTMLPYQIGTLFEEVGGCECDGVMLTEDSIILTSVIYADEPEVSIALLIPP